MPFSMLVGSCCCACNAASRIDEMRAENIFTVERTFVQVDVLSSNRMNDLQDRSHV